jgi:phosphatidylglycerol---prolipoprotein diacylglyceryl transferase
LYVDPVAFSISGFEIRWYGIITAVSLIIGFIVAYFLAAYRCEKREEVLNFAPFAVIFSILGARLLHVLVNWSYYAQNPIYIFAIRRGGQAIQGVILGGVLTLIIFCKIRKLDFWLWADISSTGLILGQAIGRWGNFFNQEAFGKPTNLPWAIYIESANRPNDYLSFEYFHPTFLYESVANFLLFIFLLFMHRYYRKRPGKLPHGLILSMYLGIYSIYRTFIEYYRVDSTSFSTPFGEVKVVYVINLITIIVAMLIADYVTRKFNKKKRLRKNTE